LKSKSAGSVQDKSKVELVIDETAAPVTIAGAVRSGQVVVFTIIVTSVVLILLLLSLVCKVKLYCVPHVKPVTL